ncbi:alpha/beta-type small acid-soluble spore protein [Bacillaceae bacterium S4-13-58]
MGRRNKILVPEARKGLDQLKQKVESNVKTVSKYEIAQEEGISLKHGYNGDIRAEDAGRIGGNIGGKIGGNMVKELISMAEKQLVKQKNQ